MKIKNFIDYAKTFNADEHVIAWIENVLPKQKEISTSEAEHIIDYLINTNKRISKMSFATAKKNADAWVKKLQEKAKDIKESKKDTEVVLDFKDGFKIVKLIGKNAYDREGLLMKHCVSSYYGNGKEVYSLRDKKNMPHCTIEKDQQIKGKGNGDIHPKYIDYVVRFLEYTGMDVRDSEMEHLGYINVEQIIKEEPDIVFPELYREKYFLKSKLNKVQNKNSISLWSIFNLFEFNAKMEVKYNFDIKLCISNFIEKIKTQAGGNSATQAGGYCATQAGGNSATQAGGDYATQAGGNYAKQAGGNYALQVAGKNSEHIIGKGGIAVGDIGSIAKGKIGSCIVLCDRDEEYNITNVEAVIIDGKKIKEDTWYHMKDGKIIEKAQHRVNKTI